MNQLILSRASSRHTSRLGCFVPALSLFAIASLTATNAWAVVTKEYGPYSVDFYNTGESFTDAAGTYTGARDWTDAQMADVKASINTWDTRIANTTSRQLKLDVIWSDLGTSVLGTSYSPMVNDLSNENAWHPAEIVWRDGVSEDFGYGYDTHIVCNTTAAGRDWYFGSEAPSDSEFDFCTVMTHELGHSLGFDSTYSNARDYCVRGRTTWDSFLVDGNGNSLAVGSTGTPGNFDETGDVYFTGANAIAANGGEPVEIYAPDPYEGGSSLYHLDLDTFYYDTNEVMCPGIAQGDSHRTPTALEWAIMKDMGWTIVPEPGTYIMLLGLVATLFASRMRKRLSHA